MPTKPTTPATATAAPTAAAVVKDDQALGALDVDAEMEGLGLAEQQAVEGPRSAAAARRRPAARTAAPPAPWASSRRTGCPASTSVRSRSSRSSLAKAMRPVSAAAEGAERDAGQQQRADGELALARRRSQHQRRRWRQSRRRRRRRAARRRRTPWSRARQGRCRARWWPRPPAPRRRRRRSGPGSASGLRNMPCIMAPATASAAPTKAPSSRRGRRMSISTSCSRAVAASAWPLTMAAEHARQDGERDAGRADRERQESGEHAGPAPQPPSAGRRSPMRAACACPDAADRHDCRHRVAPASPPARSG